jgi:hypothetical protein
MYQNIDRNSISDTIFNMLVLETINYTLTKKIENKQKIQEIEALGNHLGERIANHLLNNTINNSNTKMDFDEIMKFLGRDVWLFIFGKQIAKLQTNRKGTFLIDCEEIKFHHTLMVDKLGSDSNLDLILTFVCGIIKGVLGAFNVDCIVTSGFKPQPILSSTLSASNNCFMVNNSSVVNQNGPFSYSFTISMLNMNL